MGARAGMWMLGVMACGVATGDSPGHGTAPPPEGWATRAPTVVEQVVDRGSHQLLAVAQGDLRAWVEVPDVDARVGDHVLLGQGTARQDVPIPELGGRAREVVDIAHVRVVDLATAERVARSTVPERAAEAVDLATVYAELDARADRPIVVQGTVVKATGAIGWTWVHLRDGTGDVGAGTGDLTVKTSASVAVGQRVAFRGVLRADVDLGFGYHYDALVEDGRLVTGP